MSARHSLHIAQTTRRRITDSSAATDQELRLNEEIDCEDCRSALGCNPGLTSHRHQLSSHQPACPDGTTAARDDSDDTRDFFDLKYRGARYSFGYGSCPDLESRRGLVELLQPERIGVELSEELQLHPEQSTDAFVLYHPEAKYFNV